MKEGTPPDPSYEEYMLKGKEALGSGVGLAANQYFMLANEVHPADPEANLGIAVSGFLQFIKFADEAVDFASSFAGSTTEEQQKSASTEEGTGDTISMFLHQIFDDKLKEMSTAMDYALADPDIEFDISNIPLYFQEEVVLNLPGSWEYADAVFFDGIYRLFQSAIDYGLSVDLNFDFSIAMGLITTDLTTMSSDAVMDLILTTVYDILTDPNYPNFLLLTEEAPEKLPQVAVNLGTFFGDLVTSLQQVRDPIGPLGYEVTIDNGFHDPSENYFYGDLPALSDSMMDLMPDLFIIFSALQASLYDNSEMDLHPGVGDEFDLALLNPLWADVPLLGLIELPPTPIDLSAYFLNPSPEDFKNLLVSSLECLMDGGGIFQTLFCLLDGLE